MGIAGDVCVVVAAAWFAGLICQFLRLPLVLGYIGAGLVLSPFTWGPVVSEVHELETLADVGVALLLFTVGMEFPLPKLSQVGRVALIGTPVQVLGTIALGVGLAKILGWPLLQGVWLGCLLGLSSTVVVIRSLVQRGFLNSLSSRVMIGMLVVQDLLFVPMLLILPQLGRPSDGQSSLLTTMLLGVAFVGIWLVAGRKVLPWGFHRIAETRSRELFSLTVLAFGLGTGYLAYKLGLSLAFGAFLAGLVLAESEYAHQALHDVSPLRDLFTLLFFASVGLLIDPRWVLDHALLVFGLGAATWIGKGIILAVIVRTFGYANVVPFAVAFYMGQMGELAFVLARLGQKNAVITPELYKILITLAALSMSLTPIVARWTEPTYRLWRKFFPAAKPSGPSLLQQPLSQEVRNHTIVVGFGRVGRVVAGTLRSLELPLVVLERDAAAAHRAQQLGYSVLFGESSAHSVLEACGLERCRNIIFTYRESITLELSVKLVREVAPSVPITARAETLDQVSELRKYGAENVVWPEMEGALEIVNVCLNQLGISGPDAQIFIEEVRKRHYWLMASEGEDEELLQLFRQTWRQAQTEMIRPEGECWSGKSLAELEIRSKSGATVLGIVSVGGSVINPSPDHRLESGDALWVFGDELQRQQLRELLGVSHPK